MNKALSEHLNDLAGLYADRDTLKLKIGEVLAPFEDRKRTIDDEALDTLGLLPERLTALENQVTGLQETLKSLLRSEAGVNGLFLEQGNVSVTVRRVRTKYVADVGKTIKKLDAAKALTPFWYPGQERKTLDQILGEWVTDQANKGTIPTAIATELVREVAASTPAVVFKQNG